MSLPHSYGLVLMLTILTMVCWGSWTNVLKFTKGWRFDSFTMTTRSARLWGRPWQG